MKALDPRSVVLALVSRSCPLAFCYPLLPPTQVAHLEQASPPNHSVPRTPPLHPRRQTSPRPSNYPRIASSSPHPRNAYSNDADPRAGCAPRVENELNPTTPLSRAERRWRKRKHSSRYDGRNAGRWSSGFGDGIRGYERWRKAGSGEWNGPGEEKEGERRRTEAIGGLDTPLPPTNSLHKSFPPPINVRNPQRPPNPLPPSQPIPIFSFPLPLPYPHPPSITPSPTILLNPQDPPVHIVRGSAQIRYCK